MKKMLILILAMFVLSVASTVSAHDNQHQWINQNHIIAVDEPSPNPDDPPQPKPHKDHKPIPKEPPQPESPQL
ncbi:Hypothetical protein LUCI_1727 [Lucifera butyrica]|uniref:Uncharacterized protein n=1 Tax=Lucifera butyrica TaxID=1351585 RepID=A0A498R4X2_9FIRM|nr:hypothetical protein [Lucifera butyrica]VBB06494.1 Hypothetical protein LUCI_1727 [Lucifera butyrica]